MGPGGALVVRRVSPLDSAIVGAPGRPLPTAITFQAVDRDGRPVPGAAALWTVAGTNGRVEQAPAVTDSRGELSAVWVLGTRAAEAQGLTVQIAVGKHKATATVAAIAKPVEVSSIAFTAHDTTLVKLGVSTPMAVAATDPFGNKFVPTGTRFVSLDTSLCTIDSLGLVKARKRGFGRVVVLAGSATDTAWVHPTQVVLAILATPDTLKFHSLGQTASLTVRLLDDQGLWVGDSVPVDSVVVDTVVKVQAGSTYTIRSLSNGVTRVILRAGLVAQTVQVVVDQRVANVKLSASRVTLDALRDTVQLATTVSDSLGAPLTNQVIAYSAGDTAVVTVGPSGLVTSKGNGSTWIHAKALNGVADSVRMVVAQEVAGVAAKRDSILFDALQAVLSIQATPVDRLGSPVTTAALTYSTGAQSVATVDVSGNVRAIANGTTLVAASHGSQTAVVTVRVAQRPARVVMSADTMRFAALGETRSVAAVAVDSLGSPVAGGVTSVLVADTTVVLQVDSASVRARRNGVTTADFKVAGLAGHVILVVNQVPTALTVSPDTVKAVVGDSFRLSAAAFDRLSNPVSTGPVTWTVAEGSVATVAGNGIAHAVSVGTTVVSAHLGPLQASATIEVLTSRDSLPRILLSSQQLQLLVGDTARLGATVVDPGGTVLASPVVWSSDNTPVASVAADGLLRAQNVGTVMVSAWTQGVSAQVSARVRPGGGPQSAGLAVYDSVMLALMDRWGIPGGALALVKDGRLVLARGYGYADTATREMVGPTSLFRLASLSKPITAAAVLSLVDDGRISLDTPLTAVAGDLLSQTWVDVDPRMGQMSIRDLLDHTAGFDVAVSGEPNFVAAQIATDLGLPPPASARTIVQARLGRPLDFAPGERQVYSSFGYNVLGRVIENVTGGSYQDYVRTRVLRAAGVNGMQVGFSLPESRLPGEVRYHSATRVASQFPGGDLVSYPYGGFYLEGMDASSGWVGSVVDYMRFVTAVDGFASRPDVLSPGAIQEMTRIQGNWTGTGTWYALGWQANTAGNWYHLGSLPGLRSLVVRLSNGIEYVAVFNADPAPLVGADFFSELLDGSIRWTYLSVTNWPTNDLFNDIR